MFRSVGFQEEIAKYDKNIQDRVDKIEDKLMYNSEYEIPLEQNGLENQDLKITEFIT